MINVRIVYCGITSGIKYRYIYSASTRRWSIYTYSAVVYIVRLLGHCVEFVPFTTPAAAIETDNAQVVKMRYYCKTAGVKNG